MTSKKIIFILLVTLLSLFIEDSDAGWKFWKKDKKDDVSTPTPDITSSLSSTVNTTTSTTTPPATPTKPSSNSKSGSATKANAGAADPGLAIGVGNTGTLIKNNPQPKKPNPGTEVGLDFPSSKPSRPGVGGNNGQGYRDFILDLAGPDEPGKLAPKLPSQPPALAPSVIATTKKPSGLVQPGVTPKPGSNQPQLNQGGQTPRPSLPASPSHQPAATPKPAGISQPTPGQNNKAIHPAIPDKPQVSTLNVGPLVPTVPPTSTTGSKSWAEIAGSGGKITSTTTPISIINPGRLPSTQTSTSAYSSNPTYSKGNQVTDDDLVKLSEALFIKDTNNAYRYINLNLQKQTTGSNKKDESPQPLFTVNSQAFNIPTIAKVITIYDNYKLDTRENEYISPAQRNEESLLVDTFLSTNVMSAAMRFLADKGFIAKDYYAYKDVLRKIWFNLYSRGDGKIGSSGFEHVFLTEIKLGTELTGLHNWIYFNAEEVKKRANYLGYIKKVDLGDKAAILSVHTTFNGLDKPITTVFVGTSPELEMALYTVCFFVRSEKSCPVSLGGTKFNIITHKFKYRGNELIGSAYPEI